MTPPPPPSDGHVVSPSSTSPPHGPSSSPSPHQFDVTDGEYEGSTPPPSPTSSRPPPSTVDDPSTPSPSPSSSQHMASSSPDDASMPQTPSSPFANLESSPPVPPSPFVPLSHTRDRRARRPDLSYTPPSHRHRTAHPTHPTIIESVEADLDDGLIQRPPDGPTSVWDESLEGLSRLSAAARRSRDATPRGFLTPLRADASLRSGWPSPGVSFRSPAFPLLGLPRLTSHGSSHPSSFQPPAIHQVMRCLVLASTVVASPLWVASVLASPSLCMVLPLLHLSHLLPSSTSSPPSAPSSYLFVLTCTTWRPSWMATSTSHPLLSSSFVHMPPPLTPPSAAPSTTPSPPFFSLSASPAASPLLPLLPLLTALRVLTP